MKNVIEFEQELCLESSFNRVDLGTFFNRMELVINEKSGNGYIIWNYGKDAADEDETVIGLSFNHKKELEDYDGVYDLPKEAITLIRQNGYDLNEDLKETYPD
jgi:hypothetical protein